MKLIFKTRSQTDNKVAQHTSLAQVARTLRQEMKVTFLSAYTIIEQEVLL